MSSNKFKKVILLIILLGLIFRIVLSSNGNFIFNMDNARDMVDVREMVVLQKPRLIGPTTAIEGVFTGPAWYYLLAIPFILTGGDPYGSILMEILLWAIGGYFLLKLVSSYYGFLPMIVVASFWVASNYILLATQYAFNPNPTLLLAPVLIYFLIRYLETNKLIYSLATFILAGLFFHFEVAVGIFVVPTIVLSIIFSKKFSYFKSKQLWLGFIVYLLTLTPLVIFELRHSLFMTRALLDYKSVTHGSVDSSLVGRISAIFKSYYGVMLPTLINWKIFTAFIIAAFLSTFLWFVALGRKGLDKLTLVSSLMMVVPLIGFIPLKVDIMRWHLNAAVAASLVLIGLVIQKMWKNLGFLGKILTPFIVFLILVSSLGNVSDYLKAASAGDSNNSILRNELSVIDYTYQKTKGKNFKVYVYMPSVIDYPYQYLYWWYGLKKYGFTPQEYAYEPNVFPYIRNKDKLSAGKTLPSSGLVFLIKEPDQIGRRHLWENTFKNLPLIEKTSVGTIEIEVRKEVDGWIK